jgi:CRISPR-associated protein Cmr6
MRASRLNLPPPANAGLALQRYLRAHDEQKAAARELIEIITQTPISPAYKEAFERWKTALPGAIFLEATTRTPLAIGLGNASPLENGLTIHHTYAMPYLPGSALKGLVRRAADRFGLSPQEKAVLLCEGPDSRKKTQGNAAHLVYWDGWLDPASAQPFQKDVITVHHQDYHNKRGADDTWPSDFDDPNPVSFLSVKPGVKFYIALSSSSQLAEVWLHTAAALLKWGLENLGLGGKTNAGYGYFAVQLPPRPKSEYEQGLELLAQYKNRIDRIKPANERGELNYFLQELRGKPTVLRMPTLEALRHHLQEWKVWNPSKNQQHAEIQQLLEEQS